VCSGNPVVSTILSKSVISENDPFYWSLWRSNGLGLSYFRQIRRMIRRIRQTPPSRSFCATKHCNYYFPVLQKRKSKIILVGNMHASIEYGQNLTMIKHLVFPSMIRLCIRIMSIL
jgi:hypothetical protein